MNNRIDRIKQKLEVLKPHYINIIDQTNLHANHIAANSFQTHLKLEISAHSLEQGSLVEKHKYINSLLREEYSTGLHALSIYIK